MWSLISPRVKRISGSKNFRSSAQKDFFNTIRHKGRSEAAAWVRSNVKTVLKLWSSARYRATRRAGWRRNCHAYAAIGVPGISWNFGGPTLQGEVFQFGDNFINDDIT